MNDQKSTILGISPGTHTMGIAVLRGTTIVTRRMKIFTGGWSDEKLEVITDILEQILDKYSILVIACKKHHEAKMSHGLNQLIEKLEEISKSRNSTIHWYVVEELERFYARKKRVNKSILMDCLLAEFPELIFEYNREKKRIYPYYIKVFEAIAAADLCCHELE